MEIVLEFALFIVAGIIVFGLLAILEIYVSMQCNDEINQETSDYPTYNCKDVNKCNTWCICKQRFYEKPPTD